MEQMETCDIVHTAMGKEKLVARGYLFRLRIRPKPSKTGEIIYYWRCDGVGAKDRNCKGSAVTVIVNGKHILQKFTDHPTHKPEAGRVERHRVIEEIKKKALSTEQTPGEIVREVLRKIDPSVEPFIPKRASLWQTIKRNRKRMEGVKIHQMARKCTKNQELDRNSEVYSGATKPSEQTKIKLLEQKKSINYMEDKAGSDKNVSNVKYTVMDNSPHSLESDNHHTYHNISELITYLNDAEKIDQTTMTALESGVPLDDSWDLEKALTISKFQYLSKKDRPALIHEVITMKLIVEEKQKDVATLKRALYEQQEVTARMEKQLQNYLKLQKEECDTARGHQNDIDQPKEEKRKKRKKKC